MDALKGLGVKVIEFPVMSFLSLRKNSTCEDTKDALLGEASLGTELATTGISHGQDVVWKLCRFEFHKTSQSDSQLQTSHGIQI